MSLEAPEDTPKAMFTTSWMKAAIASGLLLPMSRAAYPLPVNSRQVSNTSTISWTACPDSSSTQCAFLEVPLDYSNPGSNATVSIFLRKYPAKVPEDQRLGSLLTNPGGPGGSGSSWIATSGEEISILVNGRYDIIGFDPRAVNLTGPPTSCHSAEAKFLQREYQLALHGPPFPHTGGVAEKRHVAKYATIQASHNAACVQSGNHEMLRNSGTVAVVKDMERIVHALGEDGLNFLGYSYGTILGATFAALRPDLVKRMVLDGVSDSESYFNDVLEWGRSGMQDTHKTLAGFISTCIEAGPEYCPLASRKDNQTETIRGLTERLSALYARLGEEPLVVADTSSGPGIIQAHHMQYLMFTYMYVPGLWADLASALADLEKGDGYAIYSYVFWQYADPARITPAPYTQNVYNRSMQVSNTRESTYPIMCSDALPLNITIDEYADYFREIGKLNSMGEQWALIMGGCRDWSFRANERYNGPWTVEKGLKKTRFPILFVSLDADPVTPLPSAIKMSRGFGNESASLLIQEGTAHPSLCTIKNIQDYFTDGKVPINGTHCKPEPGGIYPDNTNPKRAVLNKRDSELLDAVGRMGKKRAKLTLNF
ncbi:unnamed protein product [Rhizoctonia solani]|uniref:Uncharacterized protein n=1 Tax=Rhizoctonia solani TaxID=456999 RepID=A0A8H3BU09_9AGAM|nr:unnamed protein product [Rhizoctonia solani]